MSKQNEAWVPTTDLTGSKWVAHLVLNLLDSGKHGELFDGARDDGGLTVELIVNGVKIPAQPFIDHVGREFDRHVAERAARRPLQAVRDIQDKVAALEQHVEDELRRLFPDVDWGDY